MDRVGEINYKVQRDSQKGNKHNIIHINNAKNYKQREEFVGSVMVVAEEKNLESTRGILMECDSKEIDKEQLVRTLGEFGGVLSDIPGCCRDLEMDIKLAESSQPFALSPYKIPDRLKMEVKQEIKDLLSQGIIEESNAEWSSPLVPVVKDTGKIRLCIDYRKLNLLTPQVQYQMPSLDDI